MYHSIISERVRSIGHYHFVLRTFSAAEFVGTIFNLRTLQVRNLQHVFTFTRTALQRIRGQDRARVRVAPHAPGDLPYEPQQRILRDQGDFSRRAEGGSRLQRVRLPLL